MTITLDGIIFSLQRHGGITVYFRQLLEVLASPGGMAAQLSLEAPLRQDVGDLPGGLPTTTRPARRLERFRACRVPPEATVFHSSYYRLPDRRSLPSVVTVHDFIYERFRRGPQRWAHVRQKHAAIRAAQAVICISEATRQDLLEWVGETPGQSVHVIHNGVAELFRPLGSAPSAQQPFMLFVGERGGYKNFRLVLEAMRHLPDLALHCVGGGPLQEAELAGLDSSVRSRVRHLGFVSDEALNEHYNRAVCLVYPSSYEGFGIPVIEAMRAGCPVVCIDCKAVLEVGGDALLRAAAPEGAALAEAVSAALAPAQRAACVQRGLAVAGAYSWQATHERTLAVYRALGAA
jgi:mannosyltransferase